MGANLGRFLFALGVWYNFDRRNDPRSSGEMETTLTKIKYLERIYISGYGDDFMDRALDKLLAQQRTEDEASLRVLQADLAELEQRYAMRSDEFTHDIRTGSWEMLRISSSGTRCIGCLQRYRIA